MGGFGNGYSSLFNLAPGLGAPPGQDVPEWLRNMGAGAWDFLPAATGGAGVFSNPVGPAIGQTAMGFTDLLSQFLGSGNGGGGMVGSGAPSVDPSLPIPDWLKQTLGIGGAAAGIGTSLASILKAIGGNGGGQNASTLMSLLATIPQFASLIGGFQQQNNEQWNQGAKVNVLNWLRDQAGGAQSTLSNINGTLTPQMLQFMGSQTGAGAANQGDVTDRLKYLYNLIPGMFNSPTSADRVPGLNGAFDILGGAQGANNRALQDAFGGLEAGKPDLQSAIARALRNSQSNPALTNAGNDIVNNKGADPYTRLLQMAGADTLNNRGMSPEIQSIMGRGQGLLDQAHPELQTANRFASSVLGHNPILPLDQVLSLTTDRAATDANNQFNTLKRQLLQTTGIGGPAIASGSNNEMLSNLGDQALQSVAKARQDAIMGQQQLGVTQQGQAANVLGTAAGAQQGYTGQGLSTILDALKQASGREQNLPTLGLSGNQTDLSRLLGGGTLLNDASGQSNAGLSSFGNLFNVGNNANTSMLSVINSLLGNSGALNQQRIDASMGLQNFGRTNNNDMLSQLSTLLGQQGNLGNQQVNSGLGAAQIPSTFMNSLLDFLGRSGGSQASLFSNGSSGVNPFQAFTNASLGKQTQVGG